MPKQSGKQKEYVFKSGEGKETTYLFQHPGVRGAVLLRGRARDDLTGNLNKEKYSEELMKKVIVQPRTNRKYWEENEGFLAVMKEASTFLKNGS
jgi:hypothetical protein